MISWEQRVVERVAPILLILFRQPRGDDQQIGDVRGHRAVAERAAEPDRRVGMHRDQRRPGVPPGGEGIGRSLGGGGPALGLGKALNGGEIAFLAQRTRQIAVVARRVRRQLERLRARRQPDRGAARTRLRQPVIATLTLLATLVAASDQVADTGSRSRKIAILAELLRSLDADEVASAAGFLSGVPRPRRVGVG